MGAKKAAYPCHQVGVLRIGGLQHLKLHEGAKHHFKRLIYDSMAEKRDAKQTEMAESLGLRNLDVTVDRSNALLLFGHSFKVQFLERIKKGVHSLK